MENSEAFQVEVEGQLSNSFPEETHEALGAPGEGSFPVVAGKSPCFECLSC